MMYSNYQLENNPSFKMTGKDFNILVNSLVKEPKENSKPVKVGLTIRTATNNLVAKQEDKIVFLIDLDPNLGEGYFNVLTHIQKMLIDTFGNIDFNVISKTVLMPVGAFEDQGEIVIYCVLIVQDEQLDPFNTNASINFLPIDENSLNNLDNKSIMVLPTLTIVRK